MGICFLKYNKKFRATKLEEGQNSESASNKDIVEVLPQPISNGTTINKFLDKEELPYSTNVEIIKKDCKKEHIFKNKVMIFRVFILVLLSVFGF